LNLICAKFIGPSALFSLCSSSCRQRADFILLVYDLFTDQERSEHVQSTASPDIPQTKEPDHPLWIRLVHNGHAGGGIPGDLYRIILGAGLIYVAVTGSMIYFKVKAQQKGRSG